jgi:hypothetical protein
MLMIRAALFDDNLDDICVGMKTNGLESLAILRDKLFHAGHATLLLSLVKEIYHHHAATSGDIHFAKLCILSDDTLSYILIKNGIHTCLYDKENDTAATFLSYMKSAELLGNRVWEENHGWIVGGLTEFHRRVKFMSNGSIHLDMPRYAGLAAGRLYGHKEFVGKEITDDLMFSMKTIVGAFCLSLGADDAWLLLRPLFLELLLLSPDEMRKAFCNVSDLAAKCAKGNR